MRMAARRSSTAVNLETSFLRSPLTAKPHPNTCRDLTRPVHRISWRAIISVSSWEIAPSLLRDLTFQVQILKSWALIRLRGREVRYQNRSLSEAFFLFPLECWFSWQLPKLAYNLRTWGVISPFAFATPLTVLGVSIVPRVHHEEDHNACKVDVIVAYDIRIDLMWVNKNNACFTKLKL